MAEEPLEDIGLTVVAETPNGHYMHADSRDAIQREEGLGGIVATLGDLPSSLTLMFHPFRYYVLRRIEQELELRTSTMQMLRYPQGYFDVVQHQIEVFRARTSSDAFRKQVRDWNEAVSLAVTVPYEFAFNGREGEFHQIMESQFRDYGEMVHSVGLDQIKKIIAELNREARSLEPNAEILKILRFTKRKYRLERVTGALGGAVYLISMAEIIRRSTEMVFKIELPEEHDSEGFNRYFFGADRLTDDYRARGEFLRTLGLDHSIRLRWYVEGDTEFGGLETELARDGNIELINLRGEVAAAKGKGLSFRENLLADMNRSVYSWQGFSKGKAWGAKLMEFARSNQKMKQRDGSSTTRPIIEAIYLARHAADCNYFLSRTDCEIDINTGKLKNKPKQERN